MGVTGPPFPFPRLKVCWERNAARATYGRFLLLAADAAPIHRRGEGSPRGEGIFPSVEQPRRSRNLSERSPQAIASAGGEKKLPRMDAGQLSRQRHERRGGMPVDLIQAPIDYRDRKSIDYRDHAHCLPAPVARSSSAASRCRTNCSGSCSAGWGWSCPNASASRDGWTPGCSPKLGPKNRLHGTMRADLAGQLLNLG